MRALVFVVAATVLITAAAGSGPRGAENAQVESDRGSGAACAWSTALHLPDLDSEVHALTVYDDGSGPAVYAGGWFTTAGAVQASAVARWNGSRWKALQGPTGEGIDGEVDALAVYDDGSGAALYAGGMFASAGGVVVNNLARWDGNAWSAVAWEGGDGVDGQVFALEVFDGGAGPELVIGGRFTGAGGVAANNIARWNGSRWSALSGPLGNGADDEIRSLAMLDAGEGAYLYVGGSFATAGGVEAGAIARWNGVAWAAVEGPSGQGVNGGAAGPSVLDLVVAEEGGGPVLYVGGWFTSAGGIDANRIARWDGSSWSALSGPSGNGVGGWVDALAVVVGGTAAGLYAGGEFLSAGGVTTFNIARWDGSVWSAVSSGCDDRVRALEAVDLGGGPLLLAGGEFTRAGAVGASHIARWDGSQWSVVAGPAGSGVNDTVLAMAAHDDGSGPAVYVGGEFTAAGGQFVRHIGRWREGVWSDVSGPSTNGLKADVHALAVFDDGGGPALYAGGIFNKWVSPQLCNVARWDGAQWSALGGAPDYGTDGYVNALQVHDDGSGPALYVGGLFTTAGGLTANHVARWDGAQWSTLLGPSQPGVDGTVDDFAVFDDGSGPALYAGGLFTTAGGVVANNVARWDGTAWSPLAGPAGTGLDGTVYSLAVYDDGSGPALYAGGWFSAAGGVPANFVARWDGLQWSALQGPGGNGVNAPVNALVVHDDGSGPALYAGGIFDRAGGVPVHFLARWDGSSWSPVEGATGEGVDSGVLFLGSLDDGNGPALWGGGWFSQAGGVVSNGFFSWQCGGIFADGFESGDTSSWSATTP